MASILRSQDTFERLYRSQAEGHIATSMDAKGAGYVVLSAQIDDLEGYQYINVTAFNAKGNIDWSQQFAFGDTVDIHTIGDIKALKSGNILFSVVLDTDSLNKVVVLLEPSGTVIWNRLTGQSTDINRVQETPSILGEVPEGMMIHTHRIESDGASPILMSAYLEDKSIVFERSMAADIGVEAHVEDMIWALDSTIVIVGSSTSDTMPVFMAKMDTTGRILWSRSYDIAVDQAEDLYGMHMTQLIDSSIVVLGGLQALGSIKRRSFLLQVDKDGNSMLVESISANDIDREMYPAGIVTVEDTLIVMAIKRVSAEDVITTLVKYNLDSLISYESSLDTTTRELVYSGALVSGDSMSVTFLSSTYYPDFDNLSPYLAKAGSSGDTPCYEPDMVFSFDSIGVVRDTFEWQISELITDDSIVVHQSRYDNFDPPLLTLPDTVYCPQDPINFRVDASTRGAVSYLWDDGNRDSIRVFKEEGMFSVTVTIGIEECFTLCDTTNITKMMPPSVAIAKNTGEYCRTGTVLLGAQPMGQIVSFAWSTGETTAIIAVDQPGTYSVMVVDVCDLTAMASIEVTEADLSGVTAVSILKSSPDLCVDGSVLLTAQGVQDVANLTWSTGLSSVQSVAVSAPGIYTVNYDVEFCPGQATIELIEDDFDVIPRGEITAQCNQQGTAYVLTISGDNIVSQEWSDGSNAVSIAVTTAGVYRVTIRGLCGDEVEISIELSEEDIRTCIVIETEQCLRYPNVFIPSDREEINKTFGPRIDCDVENYELHIYNRWGEHIWETQNVNTRWDGLLSGKEAMGGVYYWWAKYGALDNPVISEGDVTLIR